MSTHMRILILLLAAAPAWAQTKVSVCNPTFSTCATVKKSADALDGTEYLQLVRLVGAAGDGKILDGTAAGQADVMSSAPAGTEEGLVVRPIPSGTQAVSAASLPLPTGAAQEHVTGASPNSCRLSDGTAFYDGAKSSQLPSALVGSRLDVNVGNTPAFNWTQVNGVAVLVGNGATGTGSPRVTIANDQTAFGVNLAQYTPVSGRLPVDGSGVTQPISGTATANQGTAAAGSGAWPTTVTTTTDVVVKPGDSVNNAVRVNVVAGGAGDGKILDGTAVDQADVEAASLASTTLEGLVVRPYMPGDGVLTATLRDTGTADSQNVAIVDAAGNQITSFGGGTQYAEDTASGAGDLLTMCGVVRNDVRGSLVNADLERTQLQVNASGDVRVDGSAVTQPVSGTFWQATQPVSGTLTCNQGGAWSIADITGTVSLPTGAATSANQSTAITALQLIDDVVHSGDAVLSKYAAVGAVLDDTATVAVTENQAQSLRMSTRRALLVEGVAGGTAQPVSGTLTCDVGAGTQPVSGTVTANAGTGTFTVAGAKSSNGGVPGATNLGTLPAIATAAAPAAATEGNQVGLSIDLTGNQRMNLMEVNDAAILLGNGTAAGSTEPASDAGQRRHAARRA